MASKSVSALFIIREIVMIFFFINNGFIEYNHYYNKRLSKT
ncbi:MAG: hypothetical protein PWP48_731, partial [Clostridiales bacterium]|nr:hypothetical protein [Clostridiales bacterium]